MYTTEEPTAEPIDETIQKKYAESLSTFTLNLLHYDVYNLPYVPPFLTPTPCNNITQFEWLNLHRFFWCWRFCNHKHLNMENNARLVNYGILPSTIGYFATITNNSKGKPIKTRWRYLYLVNMDIVFGDCVALGEQQYTLLLVYSATIYCYIYGI